MFFIPGFVISFLSFPGIVVHEAAHQLFCRLRRVAVLDVCYFSSGNPAGYVIHEQTDDFASVFLISMGPFFINTVLCAMFCSAAFLAVWELDAPDAISYFFAWLGISIGMHAIPSTTDLQHIWKLAPTEAKKFNPLAIISFPIIGALLIVGVLRVVWADVGYGILVGFIAPLALFKFLV